MNAAAQTPVTLVKAWTAARDRLREAQIDSPVIDARLLVEAAAGVTRLDLITDPYRLLTDEQAGALDAYVARRSRREPVSHILGRRGFWKIMVQVNDKVLTPRPETEVIVDHALRAFAEAEAFTLLDLGVGSGAILLAVLAERPLARGLGIDISEEALAVARENAANLGLASRTALMRGDWTASLGDEGFDLVVANPPYIRSSELPLLAPEVRDHEPHVALDGGEDGLRDYYVLAAEVLRVLRPGGLFLIEIGAQQGPDVAALMTAAGARGVGVLRDLTDRDRVVTGRKKSLGDNEASR